MSGKKLRCELNWCIFMLSRGRKNYVKSKNGNIINIASTYGIVGPDQRIYKNKSSDKNQNLFKPVSYSVTKGGLIQLTRYLAAYWGDKI